MAREKAETQLSQAELARKLVVSPQRLSNWESGRNDPPHEIVAEAASIFDLPLQYFYGIATTSNPPGSNPPAPFSDRESHPKVGRRLFPILGLAGASEFPIDPGDSDDFVEFSDDLYTENPHRFAIEVRGESMKNFKDRDFLLVHPSEGFRKAGHYVVARSPEGEYVTKLLTKENGQFFLSPETEGYRPIPIDSPEWRIVGPVVGHRRELRVAQKSGGTRVRSYFEIGDNLGLTPEHY